MIKKIIAGFCLFVSAVGFSQENNASPYSFYGIGDVKFKGTVENRSMGGLGILPDSIHINLQNPSMYGALKFTTFTLGASHSRTDFKTTDMSDKASRSVLDYIAVAIPANNFGFAFGLMPYTAVGYRIESESVDPGDGLTRFRRFNGNGGLNRAFGGASYKITPAFSVGADFQYNFGEVETKNITGIPESSIQYPTREINTTDYAGMSFNIGASYQAKINNKYEWTTSATYTPQSTLSSRTERQIATIILTGSNNEVVHEEIDQSVSDEDIKMPSKITFGSGFGQVRKWFAGAEYAFQEANELGNRFGAVSNASFEASHRFSLGGHYIPKYAFSNNYFNRITYRAGMKFEQTGLVINGESINDMNLSFGMGLPLGGTIGGSNLNLGVEFGQRGTTRANLVQENYFNIFISLSINDKWFIKRKYD